MDYETVGLVGFISLSCLVCIIIYRWILYWVEIDQQHIGSMKGWCSNGSKVFKRNATFALLLLASALDIPMYISFFTVHKYVLYTFGFHKLQSAAIFGAYSMTISDWNSVLFEIQEDPSRPYRCRNCSLIAINIILSIISVVNFAYCYSFPDLNTYADSKVYMLGVFIQIVAPLVLTMGMLYAGLKLSWRIQGASGSIRNSAENPKLKEFRSAVFHINIVMCSVCVTILTQVTIFIFLQ
jgi:hypothetical protein